MTFKATPNAPLSGNGTSLFYCFMYRKNPEDLHDAHLSLTKNGARRSPGPAGDTRMVRSAGRGYFSMAALNQLVRLVGCEMPVPTTTAQAPSSMTSLASAGV